ncbi:hypothetical protein [Streptomyces sp. AK04-3B]|uniref:hypothetical protein n=1 Tax=Streptomyces sp. AK04-3B TaxID=3028650 RepID=UPI0029A161CD|nr:hypothetical protein [Streptomyces sp. AK04-3B]MDX3798434.1 hypothetical protein [Streptomyces sp. AK04-3B]
MHTYRIGDAAVLPGGGAATVRSRVDGGSPLAPGAPAAAANKSTGVLVERP